MILLLVKNKLLTWKNIFLHGNLRRRLGYIAFLGFSGFLVLGLYRGSYALFSTLARFEPTAAQGMLTTIFSGIVGFALFWGVGTVLSQIYLSSDLELLLTAPLSRASIFAVKVGEGVWAVGVPALFGLTSLFAYGAATGANALYYPLAALALLAMLLLITALSMMLVMGLMRLLPARRARELWAFVWVVGFGILWFGWMMLSQRGNAVERVMQYRGLATQTGRALGWWPPGWATKALIAWTQGAWASFGLNLALLLGLTATSLWLAYLVYERTFYHGWASLRQVAPRRPRARRRRNRLAALASVLPWPARDIALKDWTMLPRDLRQLGGLIFPLLVGVFYVYSIATGFSSEEMRTLPALPFWLSLLVVPLIPFFFVTALAVPAVGVEGKNFGLLRAAPIPAWGILWGKLWMGLLPVLALAELIALIVGLFLRLSLDQFALLVVLTGWMAAGFMAIGVAAGALSPDFKADHPRRAGGVAGAYVAMIGCAVFWAANLGALAWLVLQLDPRNQVAGLIRFLLASRPTWARLAQSPLAWVMVVGVYGAVLLAIGWLWWMGVARLERWEAGAD